MKNYTTIQNVQTLTGSYLSEHLTELPTGLINKSVTGCGATSVALYNDQPYIICVPTVNLILNKLNSKQKYPMIGLFGGEIHSYDNRIKNINSIEDYLKAAKNKVIRVSSQFNSYDLFGNSKEQTKTQRGFTPKILTTYDSLGRLADALGEAVNDFHLLVDEWHCLLEISDYRKEAVQSVFENYNRFKDYSFITATPISDDFIPSAISELPRTTYLWENTVRVTPTLVPSKKPTECAAKLILKTLNGDFTIGDNTVEELFIFINSVDDICNIINKLYNEKGERLLNSENTKIVVANSSINEARLTKLGFEVGSATGKNATINFYTSVAFQGVDIESEKGLCVIVSNHKEHTKLSIDTSIFQVAGRIRTRENPFNNTFYHIFYNSEKDFNSTTYFRKIEEAIERIKNTSLINIPRLNQDKIEYITVAEDNYMSFINSGQYISKTDSEYIFDDASYKKDLYWVKCVSEIYRNGTSLTSAYMNSKFQSANVIDEDVLVDSVELSSRKYKREKCGFSTLVREYFEESLSVDLELNLYKDLSVLRDFIKHCQTNNLNAAEEAKTCKYNKRLMQEFVKQEVYQKTNFDTFKSLFTKGQKYKASDVKIKLNFAAKKLMSNKKYVAKDIMDLFKSVKEQKSNGYYYYTIEEF